MSILKVNSTNFNTFFKFAASAVEEKEVLDTLKNGSTIWNEYGYLFGGRVNMNILLNFFKSVYKYTFGFGEAVYSQVGGVTSLLLNRVNRENIQGVNSVTHKGFDTAKNIFAQWLGKDVATFEVVNNAVKASLVNSSKKSFWQVRNFNVLNNAFEAVKGTNISWMSAAKAIIKSVSWSLVALFTYGSIVVATAAVISTMIGSFDTNLQNQLQSSIVYSQSAWSQANANGWQYAIWALFPIIVSVAAPFTYFMAILPASSIRDSYFSGVNSFLNYYAPSIAANKYSFIPGFISSKLEDATNNVKSYLHASIEHTPAVIKEEAQKAVNAVSSTSTTWNVIYVVTSLLVVSAAAYYYFYIHNAPQAVNSSEEGSDVNVNVIK